MRSSLRSISPFVLIMILISLAAGCARFSIREINFYDEKTALENQILGTYRELETDPWLTTSIRSENVPANDDREGFAAPDEAETVAFDAIRQRVLLSDDLDLLKEAGTVGEALDGTVKIVGDCSSGDAEVLIRPVLDCSEIVMSENEARHIIATELLARNRLTETVTTQEIMVVLRQLYITESPMGTLIETSESNWKPLSATTGKK